MAPSALNNDDSNNNKTLSKIKFRRSSFSPIVKNDNTKALISIDISSNSEKKDNPNYRLISKKYSKPSINFQNNSFFKNKVIKDSVGEVNNIIINNTFESLESKYEKKKSEIIKNSNEKERQVNWTNSITKFDNEPKEANKEFADKKCAKISTNNEKICAIDPVYNVYKIFTKNIQFNKAKIHDDFYYIVESIILSFDEMKSLNNKFLKLADCLRHLIESNEPSNNNFLKKENLRLKGENKKIKLENDYLNEKSLKNDNLTKKYIEKISSLEDIIKGKDELINTLINKNKIVFTNMEAIHNDCIKENSKLKDKSEKYEKDLKLMNDKEKKLMRIIYLSYKKGKNIDELLGNTVQTGQIENLNNHSINNNIDQTSNQEIFSPKIEKIINKNKNIPNLDFSNLPKYESSESCSTKGNEKKDNKFINELSIDLPKNDDTNINYIQRDKISKIRENYELEKFPQQLIPNRFGNITKVCKGINKSISVNKDFFQSECKKDLNHIKRLKSDEITFIDKNIIIEEKY